MANGHGGARIGGGRKKKPLAEKIITGNPGGRPLEVVTFDNIEELQGQDMPPPKEFLSSEQRQGMAELQAAEIYKQTWDWLTARKCNHLIAPPLVEQYAMSVARWIQCEEAVSSLGFLSKHPTTGNAQLSPYITAGQNFLKQANAIWYQIYQVIRENNAAEYGGETPHDDMMEKLLSTPKRGRA